MTKLDMAKIVDLQMGFFFFTFGMEILGLNWTGHMSFLTVQDRTPKFAGQVLSDQTKASTV